MSTITFILNFITTKAEPHNPRKDSNHNTEKRFHFSLSLSFQTNIVTTSSFQAKPQFAHLTLSQEEEPPLLRRSINKKNMNPLLLRLRPSAAAVKTATARVSVVNNAGRLNVPSIKSTAITNARRWKSAPTADASTAASAAPTKSTSATTTSVPIGQSLLAALLGISTVSVAAAIVEQTTADSCPEYTSNGQRFDQSTFSGRFARMLLACDPRLLLYTETQVRQAQDVLTKYAKREVIVDNRTLWESRRIVDAALHPDTGDVIPRPFRMSGYVPYNGPICVAMVASTSTPTLLFWSWVNQSQNALVNYYVSIIYFANLYLLS